MCAIGIATLPSRMTFAALVAFGWAAASALVAVVLLMGVRGGRKPPAQGSRKDCEMTTNYTHFRDLAKEVQPPDKEILSRTLYSDNRLQAVLLGFAQAEELSKHMASMPAVLHCLQGEAKLTLGDDTVEARPGTWVHMPKGLGHSIQVKTPPVMVLLVN
jgi:quercetin dioxygenase-like cupin family protein